MTGPSTGGPQAAPGARPAAPPGAAASGSSAAPAATNQNARSVEEVDCVIIDAPNVMRWTTTDRNGTNTKTAGELKYLDVIIKEIQHMFGSRVLIEVVVYKPTWTEVEKEHKNQREKAILLNRITRNVTGGIFPAPAGTDVDSFVFSRVMKHVHPKDLTQGLGDKWMQRLQWRDDAELRARIVSNDKYRDYLKLVPDVEFRNACQRALLKFSITTKPDQSLEAALHAVEKDNEQPGGKFQRGKTALNIPPATVPGSASVSVSSAQQGSTPAEVFTQRSAAFNKNAVMLDHSNKQRSEGKITRGNMEERSASGNINRDQQHDEEEPDHQTQKKKILREKLDAAKAKRGMLVVEQRSILDVSPKRNQNADHKGAPADGQHVQQRSSAPAKSSSSAALFGNANASAGMNNGHHAQPLQRSADGKIQLKHPSKRDRELRREQQRLARAEAERKNELAKQEDERARAANNDPALLGTNNKQRSESIKGGEEQRSRRGRSRSRHRDRQRTNRHDEDLRPGAVSTRTRG
ncbi:unnamed protein product, partial [Amoebophrya sp. A120]|eukprot:GSA120T00005167001.1